MSRVKRFSDVSEKGKECKWLRILDLDVKGNHQVTCTQPSSEDCCPCSKFEQAESVSSDEHNYL